MKVTIVGEAPSKNQDPPAPIEGRIGRRLADCAGVSFEAFLKIFERTNLLAVRQDVADKGFTFDHQAAAVRARELMQHFEPGQVVILLGKRVQRAFGVVDVDYFQPLEIRGATLYVVPHPSGINRWYNEIENQMLMRNFMRHMAALAQEGESVCTSP